MCACVRERDGGSEEPCTPSPSRDSSHAATTPTHTRQQLAGCYIHDTLYSVTGLSMNMIRRCVNHKNDNYYYSVT